MANRAHALAVLLQMSEVHRDRAFLSCSQGARNDCPPNVRRLHDRMYYLVACLLVARLLVAHLRENLVSGPREILVPYHLCSLGARPWCSCPHADSG